MAKKQVKKKSDLNKLSSALGWFVLSIGIIMSIGVLFFGYNLTQHQLNITGCAAVMVYGAVMVIK